MLFYRDDDGETLAIAWLDALADEARLRCLARLELLEEKGHELRRPAAENLGGGIYELRIKFFRVNFRMLYFFHDRTVAVVSHGLAKEKTVPPAEIALAKSRMAKFKADPEGHTFRPETEE